MDSRSRSGESAVSAGRQIAEVGAVTHGTPSIQSTSGQEAPQLLDCRSCFALWRACQHDISVDMVRSGNLRRPQAESDSGAGLATVSASDARCTEATMRPRPAVLHALPRSARPHRKVSNLRGQECHHRHVVGMLRSVWNDHLSGIQPEEAQRDPHPSRYLDHGRFAGHRRYKRPHRK